MKTVVVTGANQGIGFEFCRQFTEQNFKVIGLCREKSAQLESLKIKIIEGVDVTKEVSIAKVKKELAGVEIDILVNNAGIFRNETLGKIDFDSVREQFEVNSLGPLRMSEALLPNLKKGSIVAIVTSLMGSIADNGSGAYYGYRMSKAAVNMAGMSLSRDLAKQGIAVLMLHPGYVKTRMTQNMGSVTAVDSVAGLMKQISKVKFDGAAHFRGYDDKNLPW